MSAMATTVLSQISALNHDIDVTSKILETVKSDLENDSVDMDNNENKIKLEAALESLLNAAFPTTCQLLEEIGERIQFFWNSRNHPEDEVTVKLETDVDDLTFVEEGLIIIPENLYDRDNGEGEFADPLADIECKEEPNDDDAAFSDNLETTEMKTVATRKRSPGRKSPTKLHTSDDSEDDNDGIGGTILMDEQAEASLRKREYNHKRKPATNVQEDEDKKFNNFKPDDDKPTCKNRSKTDARLPVAPSNFVRIQGKVIYCPFRGTQVKSQNSLPTYLAPKPTNPPEPSSECHICHKTFTSIQKFKDHMYNHKRPKKTSQPTDKYACHICDEIFSTKPSRRHHIMATHSATQGKRIACTLAGCDATFSGKNYLRTHFKAFHSNERYVCELCGKSFPWQRSYARHKEMAHNYDGGKLSCSLCSKLLKNEACLKSHLASIHNQVSEHACHLCDKKFKKKVHLQHHLNTHDGKQDGLNRSNEDIE